MKQALLALAVVISMNCFGQQMPEVTVKRKAGDSTPYTIIVIPTIVFNTSIDSMARYTIPSQGIRMYTDEQKLYQSITERQLLKYIQYSKLDTVITKSK